MERVFARQGMKMEALFLYLDSPSKRFANVLSFYSYFYPLYALRFLPCHRIPSASPLRPQKWG